MDKVIKNKAELMLALLFAGNHGGAKIEGITRLEKLLFLLKKEQGFLSNVKPEDDFNFFAFRMGPWTNEVYDEVDFLESLGLLEREKDSRSSPADNASFNEFNASLKDLFSESILDKYQKTQLVNDDKSISEVFKLTDLGREKALLLWNKLTEDEKRAIQDIKQKFNQLSLKQLLRYVYKKYPEYATESEIKDSLGLID